MRADSWPAGRVSEATNGVIQSFTVISSLKIVSSIQKPAWYAILICSVVFLAAPRGYDEDGIPIYPTARLGDFGLALITGEEDSDNPKKFKGIGTMGYRAPVGVALLPLVPHAHADSASRSKNLPNLV